MSSGAGRGAGAGSSSHSSAAAKKEAKLKPSARTCCRRACSRCRVSYCERRFRAYASRELPNCGVVRENSASGPRDVRHRVQGAALRDRESCGSQARDTTARRIIWRTWRMRKYRGGLQLPSPMAAHQFPVTALREISVLRDLKHPCIVNMEGVVVGRKRERCEPAKYGAVATRVTPPYWMDDPQRFPRVRLLRK